MKWDYTLNPASLLGWGTLLFGLLWNLSRFVAELKQLVTNFSKHEDRDEARFKSIETAITQVVTRVEELRDRLPPGH